MYRKFIMWLTSILEWFVPSWAWSRAEKRLDDLFPDIDMRTTVLFSLLKLPVEQRIEFFEESNENTIGLLKYLSGLVEEDQVGDASVDNSSGVMAWQRASSSVSASKLTANELKVLMSTLKCEIVPVEDDKAVFANLQESGLEFEWIVQASAFLSVWTPNSVRDLQEPGLRPPANGGLHCPHEAAPQSPHGIELVDANKGPSLFGTHGVAYRVYELDFTLKGRNDALFVPKRFLTQAENFAFIGMEIKESLNPEMLIRAQAQFIAWGLQSYMAYMQVFSDLRSGGVAWWVDKDIPPGVQIIRRQSFAGMPALYQFLNSASAAVPERMLRFDASGRPIKGETIPFSRELQQPTRCKLKDPSLEDPEALREIWKEVIAALDDDDARDPDVALADWFPDGGDEPIKFPDEPSPS